ncbi:UDP-galactopyranose mutase [Clostridia bacterium]|nr:UDP-galactopyranose mutase [Clostridia bacterium]
MKNIIVVGAGFSGAVLARKIAEELDLPVKVIEKRNHIAGNMYDETDENGILLQKYGPHIVCTDKYSVIEYLSKYSDFFKHTVKLLSLIDGNYVRLPFNFETVQQLVGEKKSQNLIAKLRKEYNGRDRVPAMEIMNNPDSDISDYGTLLFDKAYKTYCAKQWDIPVETIDKSIMDRVPVAMNYDERYMNKDFQYLPEKGFTKLFENLLDHENISIETNTDAAAHISFLDGEVFYDGARADALVFTGAVDELFGLKYGALPYRSLDIRYTTHDAEEVLPEAIVSYPQADGYTRETEYKRLMPKGKNIPVSVIATEYPVAYDKNGEVGNTPYYPVITEQSLASYAKYLEESKLYKNIFLCGRLAEFRYYNMDDCILHAFDVFEEIKKYFSQR